MENMKIIFDYLFSKISLLENLISPILYCFFIISIWFIFGEHIMSILTVRKRYRFKKIEKKKENIIVEHIRMLLNIVFNINSDFIVSLFFIISASIFFLSMIILKNQSNILFSVAFSLIMASLPYAYLFVKIRLLQVEGSFEGEMLVSEIINQYKINYFNMSEAIDKTITFIPDSPHSRKMLFRLSVKLKEYKTEEELEKAIREFVYSIDTEWVKILANNIELAIDDGMNVVVALEDLLKEIRRAKSSYEENKRLNIEGAAIVKFLSPLMYLGSIYFSTKYFSFSIQKFYNYQLKTSMGLKSFMIIFVLFIINLGVTVYFKKKKFDF